MRWDRSYVPARPLSGRKAPAVGAGTMALAEPTLQRAGRLAARYTSRRNLYAAKANAAHAERVQIAAVTPMHHVRDLNVTAAVERRLSALALAVEAPVGAVIGNEFAGGLHTRDFWTDRVGFVLELLIVAGHAALFGILGLLVAHGIGHIAGSWMARRSGRTFEGPTPSHRWRIGSDGVLITLTVFLTMVLASVYVGNQVRGDLLSTQSSYVAPWLLTLLVMSVPMLAGLVLAFRFAFPGAVRLEQIQAMEDAAVARLDRVAPKADEWRHAWNAAVNAAMAATVLSDLNPPEAGGAAMPAAPPIASLLNAVEIGGVKIRWSLDELVPLDTRPVRYAGAGERTDGAVGADGTHPWPPPSDPTPPELFRPVTSLDDRRAGAR